MSFTWGAPTPVQAAAIRTARTIGALQTAELVRLHRLREESRLGTPEVAAHLGVLEARALAGVQLLYRAYRQIHRAYGGLAPTSVIKPIVEAYYAQLGTAPDAGEWPT